MPARRPLWLHTESGLLACWLIYLVCTACSPALPPRPGEEREGRRTTLIKARDARWRKRREEGERPRRISEKFSYRREGGPRRQACSSLKAARSRIPKEAAADARTRDSLLLHIFHHQLASCRCTRRCVLFTAVQFLCF